MRLKRWESPRHQGRNDKGKGGSARARQIRKQFKMMSKKLKGQEGNASPLFYSIGRESPGLKSGEDVNFGE